MVAHGDGQKRSGRGVGAVRGQQDVLESLTGDGLQRPRKTHYARTTVDRYADNTNKQQGVARRNDTCLPADGSSQCTRHAHATCDRASRETLEGGKC